MIKTIIKHPWLTGALLAIFALSGTVAHAQYAHNPFFDHTVELWHTYAIEIMNVRLAALAAFDDVPEELLEEAEDLVEEDLPRFKGSLAASDAPLAHALEEALEEVIEVAETDDSDALKEAIARARELTWRADAALVPGEMAARPEFVAAVVAKLVLNDDGVAEAYEDAVEEELWEYPNGWAALQRVRELWQQLRPLASTEQAFEIEDALQRLAELFPSPVPPDLEGADPEAGEDPGRQLVSTLEVVANAYLYPERELGRVADVVTSAVRKAQAAYEAGQVDLAWERVMLADFYYHENLRRLFELIVPDVHGRISEALESLLEGFEEAEADTEEFDGLLAELEQGRTLLGL
ncbi:MAG: hypothetical protein H0Z37_00375 [Firmicutes bacterium]|nr:hypothetical protein [Bacillota bacterium]